MASLRITDLQSIQAQYPEYVGILTFVETGTSQGGTIYHMAEHFPKLITIEISQELFQLNMAYIHQAIYGEGHKELSKIVFLWGNSTTQLIGVLQDLQGPAIFFLDAEAEPLLEELRLINNLHDQDSIIIINGYEKFGLKVDKDQDWSGITVESIIGCFNKGQIKAHFVSNNRYILLLETGNPVIDPNYPDCNCN